jgi:patatin-like phospholipase/acyl hydrolase
MVIEAVVGKGRKMSELRRPTLIPAVNLTKGGPRVFKTGHHPRFTIDWRLDVVDVALATSAAPTYFPIHRIGDEAFADGGLFANSPDLIGLHEAEHFLCKPRDDIKVLSIGTTTTEFAFSSSAGRRLGSFGWMKNERLTTIMIGSQQAVTNDLMMHNLGDRYIRIDRMQSTDQKRELALDCASSIAKEDLQAMAANSVQEISPNKTFREMLRHVAPPFAFVNAAY